jgi:outer membrane protein TolC
VAKRGLEYAEKELSDARDRYENNLAPNSEVLDAEARRTGNYTLYYNAIYDAVLSEIRLRSVAGGLHPQTMLAGHDKES